MLDDLHYKVKRLLLDAPRTKDELALIMYEGEMSHKRAVERVQYHFAFLRGIGVDVKQDRSNGNYYLVDKARYEYTPVREAILKRVLEGPVAPLDLVYDYLGVRKDATSRFLEGKLHRISKIMGDLRKEGHPIKWYVRSGNYVYGKDAGPKSFTDTVYDILKTGSFTATEMAEMTGLTRKQVISAVGQVTKLKTRVVRDRKTLIYTMNKEA